MSVVFSLFADFYRRSMELEMEVDVARTTWEASSHNNGLPRTSFNSSDVILVEPPPTAPPPIAVLRDTSMRADFIVHLTVGDCVRRQWNPLSVEEG